jgi:predicted SnoaL-like aldol condensation-catalyzing enzyme
MIIIAEGDLVMAHGRYSGGGGKTLIAADIFRFEGDLIVEHWDVLQEEVATERTVAGNPMFTRL